MKLPLIKKLVLDEALTEEDFGTAVEVLLSLAEARGLKDDELEVIGELISNIEGAVVVREDIAQGSTQREALNGFMKRVTGSIVR